MKIEKTECSYQVTECDLKFGEQITLDGELLIPVSVLDKIKEEINSPNRGTCDYFIVDSIEEIIDKYKAERVCGQFPGEGEKMICADCIHCKWDSDDGYKFMHCNVNDPAVIAEVVEGGECEDYKHKPFEE